MPPHQQLAFLAEQQLRAHAVRIDLRNRGRYRSTFLLDEFFFDLVEIAQPTLFVEAGAFDASASRRVAASTEARVVAFEANPTNHAVWSEKVDFGREGVDYRFCALSDKPGTVTFNLRSGSGEESFEDNSILPALSRSTHAVEADPTVETVDVSATTLDHEFIGASSSTSDECAIWVDVEGANGQVIEGGEKFFRSCSVVKIEVEDQPLWAGQWLATDVIARLMEHGLLPLARDVQFEGQYNLIMVSPRLARDPRVVLRHQELLRAQIQPELPGPVGALRRDERVRSVARRLRDLRP